MFIIVIPVAVVPHFRNVTYVGTISEAEEISTLPIIENFNSFVLFNSIGKEHDGHVWTPPRTVNSEKSEASAF